MAIVMGERDLSAFELLVGRMDARRLIELCKIKNREIEQALLDRLRHYERKMCPLRDKLAHHGLARADKTTTARWDQCHDTIPAWILVAPLQ